MSKVHGQFTFALTNDEAAAILEPSGSGWPSHELHRMLVDQLQGGGREVTMNDRQFDHLVGFMVEAGSTDEDRLRRVLVRPISELLGRDRALGKASRFN